MPAESAVVESHPCKKMARKNGAPGGPEVAAEVAAEVGTLPAALPGTEDALEYGSASRKSLRTCASFPYNKKTLCSNIQS
jgi:hypothetical protein